MAVRALVAVRQRWLAAWLSLAAAGASACAGAPGFQPASGAQPGGVAAYRPWRTLGPLFHDVQLAAVFPDSKTFVDAQPLVPPAEIAARYRAARPEGGPELRSFVTRHFALPDSSPATLEARPERSMAAHITALWPALTRQADTVSPGGSTLLPLPHPYVVPGGRFREVYYWDSYFTMLGLVASGHTRLVRSMLDNFAHLVSTYGHIPNGNRSYYLSRSQPPFFGAMIGLLARATDTAQALPYLPALEAEHAFWMEGAASLAPGRAHRRVVRLRDGTLLNRYWDDLAEPRPESYREDFELAQTLAADERAAFYRDIRAAAESGWDFSSRWQRDPADLRTIETTELVPIDLNSILYHSERLIARLRARRDLPADSAVAAQFERAAAARRTGLVGAAWDSASGYFYDVRWRTGERVTDRATLAAAAALYFGLATPAQGAAVAARLEGEFLAPGGLVTTTIGSGQQWDSPNGWAPLQWLGAEGARRYGRGDLAARVRERWLALNRRTYEATGRMMEKYDVVDPNRPAGGGEYPTQDGFGWSNGVALAFAALERVMGGRGPEQDSLPDLQSAAPSVRRIPAAAEVVSHR